MLLEKHATYVMHFLNCDVTIVLHYLMYAVNKRMLIYLVKIKPLYKYDFIQDWLSLIEPPFYSYSNGTILCWLTNSLCSALSMPLATWVSSNLAVPRLIRLLF